MSLLVQDVKYNNCCASAAAMTRVVVATCIGVYFAAEMAQAAIVYANTRTELRETYLANSRISAGLSVVSASAAAVALIAISLACFYPACRGSNNIR